MHQSGFVNIVGKPNVGKSTLMNALLGQELSMVNPKAQTTRHRIKGILNDEHYQIVFSDTPGIMKPAYKLHHKMLAAVEETFTDADVVVYVTEVNDRKIDEELKVKLTVLSVPEIVRERILSLYQQEIPYSVEVVVTSYKEDETIDRISVVIYCARETQKAILIGHQGKAIKKLGMESRKKLETVLEKQVFIELTVKVADDWRDNDNMLKRFGYEI